MWGKCSAVRKKLIRKEKKEPNDVCSDVCVGVNLACDGTATYITKIHEKLFSDVTMHEEYMYIVRKRARVKYDDTIDVQHAVKPFIGNTPLNLLPFLNVFP